MFFYFSFNLSSLQLKVKNGQKTLKCKFLPPDQLKDITKDAITMFSSKPNAGPIIFHYFKDISYISYLTFHFSNIFYWFD